MAIGLRYGKQTRRLAAIFDVDILPVFAYR
jgi:hypothetical protein